MMAREREPGGQRWMDGEEEEEKEGWAAVKEMEG